MREEGFARLPRRRDDERPLTLKPEPAAVANVRQLDLYPRSFRTRFGGLFLFVPLLRSMDLERSPAEPTCRVPDDSRPPSPAQPPGSQAHRQGAQEPRHGLGLRSRVGPLRRFERDSQALLPGRLQFRHRSANQPAPDGNLVCTPLEAGLRRGDSFDLDFHTVPANTLEEPLEKHYVSSRSRSQKGILVFLARDATERVLCYANAGLTKAQQPDEILRFVEFWKRRTGRLPAELVFDSRLTTYAQLDQLNRQDIHFITLRRRSKKCSAKSSANRPRPGSGSRCPR